MWTNKPPTEPGWYWWRDGQQPDAMLIERDTGPDRQLTMKYHVSGISILLDMVSGEWWSEKIEEPIE